MTSSSVRVSAFAITGIKLTCPYQQVSSQKPNKWGGQRGQRGSDLAVETSHELDVEGLQRVAGGLNKVDTRVNAVIDDIRAVGFILCFQVCVETAFNAF